ncbi:tetratricopeptide repeat protein [Carboxylicivirga caseinilyticus]|uniref:tetratricopeptide repeat protein n=1 Tax=Carboxylicivirga caseinilyticus TaxID=3417572 RepID=UPI003D32862E|nr:tetratricopeptide repeat protein [Marinilabiliaceae bacterium A049]
MIHLSNDISNAIANEMKLVVDDSKKAPQINPRVYDLYLKAHHLWLTQKPQSIRDAIEFLEQSMTIDSGYAPAYSLLAECYISLNKFIRNNDEKLKNRQNGRAAIDKALDKAIEIDGSLAEAYITKGNILGKFDYNWEGMKEMVDKGLRLNPNNSTGYIALHYYYSVKGELDKCIEMAKKAEELDPLNPRTLSTVANAYVLAGRYTEAIEQYQNAIKMFSDYGFAWDGLGYAYYMMGDTAKAIEAWSELHRIIGNPELVKYYQTESFHNSIRFWLDKTTSGEKLYCSNPSIIAMVHLFVGDPEGAMDYIEFAYQYKHLDLPFIIIKPNFQSLYSHPRFNEIAKDIGVNLANYKKRNI